MKKLQFGVVDYGAGNVGSVVSFLKRLNFGTLISHKPQELESVDIVLLPGVGAFYPALSRLQDYGLDKFIIKRASSGRPIIGICLGMQLLGRSSTENGCHKGLSVFVEDVLPLNSQSWHIGWNSVKSVNKSPITAAFENRDFYFNHAYCFRTKNSDVVGETSFAGTSFPAIMKNESVIGLQFHPEKSQEAGLDFFENLITLIS